jgi:hypothetical protein
VPIVSSFRPRSRLRATVAPGSSVVALVVLSAAVVVVAKAAAQETVQVGATGCGALDTAALARLLADDLAASTEAGPRRPEIGLRCRDRVIQVVVTDPVSRRQLRREVPMPPANERGWELTLALSIAELFFSSWQGLVAAEAAPAAPAAASASATSMPSSSASPSPSPSPSSSSPSPSSPAPPPLPTESPSARSSGPLAAWEATARAGAQVHRPTEPLSTWAFGARLAFQPPSWGDWWALAELGLETGEARRAAGTVASTSFGGLVGLARRVRFGEVLAVDASVQAGGGVHRSRGQPNAPDVRGETNRGSFLTALFSVGPTLRLGRLRLGVGGLLGIVGPRLTTRVDGERSVEASGLLLGAALSVGAAWGGGANGR